MHFLKFPTVHVTFGHVLVYCQSGEFQQNAFSSAWAESLAPSLAKYALSSYQVRLPSSSTKAGKCDCDFVQASYLEQKEVNWLFFKVMPTQSNVRMRISPHFFGLLSKCQMRERPYPSQTTDLASKSHFAHGVNDIAFTSLKDEIADACHCFDNVISNVQKFC